MLNRSEVAPARGNTVLQRGVDWLTATYRSQSREPIVQSLALNLARDQEREGFDFHDWQWQGYTGFACGPVQCGHRPDGTIVRLSSDVARRQWQRFATLATNVSRLDLQTTIQTTPPDADVARRARDECVAYLPNLKQPPTVTLVQTHPAGDTLYVGRRASDRFARLYDKHTESKELYPPGSWRYELELKGEVAQRSAKALCQVRDPSAIAQSEVWRYFTDRGVTCLFPAVGPGLDVSIPNRTSDQTRMAWLESSVAPAVKALATRHPRSALLRVLGLEQVN